MDVRPGQVYHNADLAVRIAAIEGSTIYFQTHGKTDLATLLGWVQKYQLEVSSMESNTMEPNVGDVYTGQGLTVNVTAVGSDPEADNAVQFTETDAAGKVTTDAMDVISFNITMSLSGMSQT